MKPHEALQRAIERGLTTTGLRSMVPGYVVSRMSADEREALQRLTSEDMKKLPDPPAGAFVSQDTVSEAKLAFDRRIVLGPGRARR